MALKHLFTVGSVFTALLITSFSTTEAQIHLPGPRFEHRDLEGPDETGPLVTPGVFDYDAQLFAPVEFTNSDQLESRSGFYASYDRTYLSVSKSPRIDTNTNFIDTGSHFIWGSRYEVGWFTEDESGWAINYQQSEGNAFANGQNELVPNPTLITNAFSSVELNRVFRQTISNGGTLEPYIGLRYIGVTDDTIEDTSQDFVVGILPADNRFIQKASNSAIGLHAGGRFVRRTGRWRYNTDVAMAALYNQQKYFASDILQEINGTNIVTSVSESSVEDQSFVPAIDLQFDITFNVTRDISLKTGVQTIYLWNGINRANTLTTGLNPNSIITGFGADSTNDNRYLAAGFIFGFEWRR